MTEWDINPWKLDKLRTMRESGSEFDEIAEELEMSQNACKMKCCIEGIYKSVKSKSKPSPLRDESGNRACITCRKDFHSWHKKKNQRCARCARLEENSMAFDSL